MRKLSALKCEKCGQIFHSFPEGIDFINYTRLGLCHNCLCMEMRESSEKNLAGALIDGYRFDEDTPIIDVEVHCFKSNLALVRFIVNPTLPKFQTVRFWNIHGTLVRDEGGEDGLVIKVIRYKQFDIEDSIKFHKKFGNI